MQIELNVPKRTLRRGDPLVVRLTAFNDGNTPIQLDVGLLVGPNLRHRLRAAPFPISLERPPAPVIQLNPWTLYGRVRRFAGLLPGKYEVFAYLLSQPTAGLLPDGPADPALLAAAAKPLLITVRK